jgi:hypothetical protein
MKCRAGMRPIAGSLAKAGEPHAAPLSSARQGINGPTSLGAGRRIDTFIVSLKMAAEHMSH